MMVTDPEPALNLNPATWVSISDPGVSPFGKGPGVTVVQPVVRNPIHVSSTAEEALITGKTMPVYPPIARAARVEGTVRLAATISKTGNIENLRVTSGPAMLQQAALDAVRSWRYRPYILDGQPVEVETTVDVIFTLSR
jgi:protein TonB